MPKNILFLWLTSKVSRVECRYKGKGKGFKMKTRDEIMTQIAKLRYDLDWYREDRKFGKVAEIRLEIARLENILHRLKEPVFVGG